MYCLIYCINIYILFCYVVELYALRGAEGWWGSQLAWIRNSLIIYVTLRLDHPYALQIEDEIAGSHRWDIAGMRFLTRGHPKFRGYWKVNVEQALSLSDKDLVRGMKCYLSCGFKRRNRTTGLEPWVFLYTESFHEQYNGTGIVPSPFLQGSGQSTLATSRLYLVRYRYTSVYLDASIKVDEQPRKFRLKLNWTKEG
jgi:hypothetical protein